MSQYWQGRGYPWEYDPGPPKNRSWARLFAQTPNYRGLGVAATGSERFRWHFGPMFYRGRLKDNSVKVLVIGQEGAQDESLSHRSFTGGTGARMQHFLNYIGITESYLFLNTFVYPIYGQYVSSLQWLAQDPDSPIVQHRHQVFNYVLERNDVHLVIAVGNAAKESVVSWVEWRGGSCPQGIKDISQCTAANLDPSTKIIGVVHPGGAGKGGALDAIKADFRRAAQQIKGWMDADPNWLPPDPSGSRHFDQPYEYESAPVPFADFSYGFPLRLGQGGTSSNRMDEQRSIQIFSENGKYNAQGDLLSYGYQGEGSQEGYSQEARDLPYEPPKARYQDYDKGPGKQWAKLLMGGNTGLEWPDFAALGASAHPSLGCGAIYRGRPSGANVLLLADQQSHDDLFTGRALSGESGQRLQAFLQAMGIVKRYVIIRVLPIDTLDFDESITGSILSNPQTIKVYQAILDRIISRNKKLRLILTFGPNSRKLAQSLDRGSLSLLNLKAWKEDGALADWQSQLAAISRIGYEKETPNPSFSYDGSRGQIPRFDLPYGVLRWIGTSGDRGSRPIDNATQRPSPDYYKIYMPDWAHRLEPSPLSKKEQKAVDSAP
jgi:uracil-DNA glycosylase